MILIVCSVSAWQEQPAARAPPSPPPAMANKRQTVLEQRTLNHRWPYTPCPRSPTVFRGAVDKTHCWLTPPRAAREHMRLPRTSPHYFGGSRAGSAGGRQRLLPRLKCIWILEYVNRYNGCAATAKLQNDPFRLPFRRCDLHLSIVFGRSRALWPIAFANVMEFNDKYTHTHTHKLLPSSNASEANEEKSSALHAYACHT